MRKVYGLPALPTNLAGCVLVYLLLILPVSADTSIDGLVYDLNGNPVNQAQVSVRTAGENRGADVVTVFTDSKGRFRLPRPVTGISDAEDAVVVRKLGYETVSVNASGNGKASMRYTAVVRTTNNYADVAPASAWLAGLEPAKMDNLVNNCIGCHQVPASEFRAYAKQVANVKGDPEVVWSQSWGSLIKYMNYLSAEEFGRGADSAPPDANRVYAVGDGDEIAAILTEQFHNDMQRLDHYDYGAPLAVTPETVIMEYEVPRPNAIREAVLGGSPQKLWAADVSSSRMIAIDVATGKQTVSEVPSETTVGPHSLHRGKDGSIWVAPFFSTVIGNLDPDTGKWQTWKMRNTKGQPVGIHDLSFGYEHELLTDAKGRIWFSDIGNNAVGYLDPTTGKIENFVAPEIPGRPGRQAALYGLVMTSDRKHVWYSQFGIGSFGSFNVETLQFDHSVQLPSVNSGPRRLSIDDNDIMYVPLYGAGQLIEFDTRTNTLLAIHDLPDRASAPYAVTWDQKRRVVWIPTSNGDVIYRFDPADKSFGVIPLPRTHAFLRMLTVDADTGFLVTSYANIVEHVHGPRMALIIDPGDDAYQPGNSPLAQLISRNQ